MTFAGCSNQHHGKHVFSADQSQYVYYLRSLPSHSPLPSEVLLEVVLVEADVNVVPRSANVSASV